MKKILEFEDYTKILVINDGNFFNFYEDEIKPKNICSLKAFVTSVRLEYFNNNNIEYFKILFNGATCLHAVNGILFI